MRSGPMVRGGRREAGTKLGDKARERLRQAHELATDGKHGEAATELEAMASIARTRGLHRIAVHLGTRAASQATRAGDFDGAAALTRAAIADAKADGDKSRTGRAFGRVIKALQGADQADLAGTLAVEIREGTGVVAKAAEGEPASVNRAMRRRLPKACATCGSKVDGDAVSFNEDATVDCPVCGGILKG